MDGGAMFGELIINKKIIMENTIRTRRNSLTIHFAERGENFTLNLKHKPIWDAIVRFLRVRGFKVSANGYYESNSKCLSKYHKIAFKGHAVCLLEITSHSIILNFGHRKNLWKNMTVDFWENNGDDRYTPLSYLEEKAVELEILRVSNFLDKYGFKRRADESKLKPVDFIIHNEKINTHVHGKGIEKLQDIAASITEESYTYKYNSNDLNGKKITCGELKYFYCYRTNRLVCGEVWHNINNMWWVISNNQLWNVAAFNLMDFDEQKVGRVKKTEKEKLQIIKRKLYESERNKDYIKCHKLNEYLISIAA